MVFPQIDAAEGESLLPVKGNGRVVAALGFQNGPSAVKTFGVGKHSAHEGRSKAHFPIGFHDQQIADAKDIVPRLHASLNDPRKFFPKEGPQGHRGFQPIPKKFVGKCFFHRLYLCYFYYWYEFNYWTSKHYINYLSGC